MPLLEHIRAISKVYVAMHRRFNFSKDRISWRSTVFVYSCDAKNFSVCSIGWSVRHLHTISWSICIIKIESYYDPTDMQVALLSRHAHNENILIRPREFSVFLTYFMCSLCL